MWDSLKSLTSYQDLDAGKVLPLLNEDNQPVFDMQDNVTSFKIHSSVEST